MKNRIVRQLDKSFRVLEAKRVRGWDRIYIAVDVHETMLEPTWSDEKSHKFYKNCVKALRMLSNRKDVVLILWTCSNTQNALDYQTLLKEQGIEFTYINKNPEVDDKHYANYQDKFYANLILDDKAGFEPEEDFEEICIYLSCLEEIESKNCDNFKTKEEVLDQVKQLYESRTNHF